MLQTFMYTAPLKENKFWSLWSEGTRKAAPINSDKRSH